MPYRTKQEKRDYRKRYYRANKEKCLTYSKQYAKEHAEEISAKRKIYMTGYKERNLKSYLVAAAKHRAKKYGIPFDLIPDDFEIPNACPVFGHAFEPPKKNAWWSPSLDRVIPELGYVKGNIQVISMRANMLKSDATPDELEAVAQYARRVTPVILPPMKLCSA
jgi:hypothetical protein